MNSLELEFHREMLSTYERAKRECGYQASRFLQMVTDRGGVAAAKDLLREKDANKVSDGFTTLWEHGLLELSVEAVALKMRYATLFTSTEKQVAKERLLSYGYNVGDASID